MPLYQYECTGCKNIEERLQTIAELEAGIDTPTVCAGCDAPYERMVGGASIALCETTFYRDVRHSVEEYDTRDDDFGAILKANAKARGISTTGKVYLPCLADFPQDPEALVGSIDDIKQLCKRRGWVFNGVKDGNVSVTVVKDFSRHPQEQIQMSELGT